MVLLRAGATVSSLQSQLQGFRENLATVVEERNGLRRDLAQKHQELEVRMSTINQVKKIGRRYKTQYEDLKAEHDKVRNIKGPGISTAFVFKYQTQIYRWQEVR